MKSIRNNNEIDYIGTFVSLTVEEELIIQEYFKQQKLQSLKRLRRQQIRDLKSAKLRAL